MNPPAVQAPRDAMAFGTNGKEWDGLSAGLGQVIKVAQKEQDEADYMSAMKAKNDIRAKIMDGVYGEGGLFETGVGENAAGLTDRVTELVQKTYQEEGSKYNGRVQRLLLGDYNENTMNLQRISSSKEMSEREKLVDENYGIALDQAAQNAAMNAGDAQTLSLCMETDGHIPQNGETADYVARVMANYKANKEKQGAGGAGFDMMGGTYYDVNPGAEAQVEGLNGNTWQKLQAIAYAYEQQFGERLFVTSGAESGGHNDGSKHYRGIAFDVAMDGLKQHTERRAWLMAHAGEYGLIPLDEYDEGGYEGYEHYDGYKSGENFHFSDNEEPFDASAVSASGGGGGHWESAYDPVRLEKAYKMIDAERAGAQSAQKAKEDQYTDIIIGQIRDCGDGATAVSILESHRDDLTPSGYSKAKSAVSMYYAGAIPSASRGDWGSDGTRSGGPSAFTQENLAQAQETGDYSAQNEALAHAQENSTVVVDTAANLAGAFSRETRHIIGDQVDDAAEAGGWAPQSFRRSETFLEYFQSDEKKLQRAREIESVTGIPADSFIRCMTWRCAACRRAWRCCRGRWASRSWRARAAR